MSRFNVADATKLQSRDGGITKGGLIRNGFVEEARNGEKWVWMRPALSTSVAAPLTGRGLGMFYVGTTLWGMYGTGTGTGATNVTSATIGFAITRNLNITGPQTSADVYTAAQALYGDANSAVATYIVTVSGEIKEMTWDSGGSFAGGCAFQLINQGTILGTGGGGGNGGAPTGNGQNGATGGNALNLNGKTVTIDNGNGNIWGGGGGGGGGGGTPSTSGGGGGGGAGYGVGGTGANSGSDGTQTTGGAGGAGSMGSGIGGDGGDTAAAGSDGASGVGFPTPPAGGTGGNPGKAIELAGGTANFTSGSGSPNVQGAVS